MSIVASRWIDPRLDGALILWRYFLSNDDRQANEGHVRQFTPAADFVRIAETTQREDRGTWLRVADLRLVSVLAESAELTDRPKRPRDRIEGDEWKDGGCA